MKKIPLTQGKIALVDDQDYERLSQCKWTYSKQGVTGYAYRNVYDASRYMCHQRMHNVILNPPDGMECDHINGDRLDNRRENLRACTHQQNVWNSNKRTQAASQYKGVSWDSGTGRWDAQIQSNGKKYRLGRFANELEAAIAYNEKAREIFGEFARLNNVPNRPPRRRANKRRALTSSRYVGVSWSRRCNCWRAEIRVQNNLIFLGHFSDENEAAHAFNEAAIKYRGTKAFLNQIA